DQASGAPKVVIHRSVIVGRFVYRCRGVDHESKVTGLAPGSLKPDLKLDPGFLEHLRLSPRAVIGPGARFLEFFFTGPHADDATQEEEMELLHRRCCGLDVHKETVVACLRLASDGQVTTEVRTFQTTTADLLRLSEWLAVNECTHVAMEATGVYWKPVWHIL